MSITFSRTNFRCQAFGRQDKRQLKRRRVPNEPKNHRRANRSRRFGPPPAPARALSPRGRNFVPCRSKVLCWAEKGSPRKRYVNQLRRDANYKKTELAIESVKRTWNKIQNQLLNKRSNKKTLFVKKGTYMRGYRFVQIVFSFLHWQSSGKVQGYVRTLMQTSVQGGASALGRRGGREGEHLANREFAFGALPGVKRARVHTAIATCPESDHHAAAKSTRSAFIIRNPILVGGRTNEDIKNSRDYNFFCRLKPLLRFYCRGTIAERCSLLGRERIHQ